MEGMTFSSWAQDHYILQDLERSDWEEVAADINACLTDSVIGNAVHKLPPEYYRLEGMRMESALKKRRDRLIWISRRFYLRLARRVDIQMTDKDELVEITKIDEKKTDVSVFLSQNKSGNSSSEPYYKRRFYHDETKELRLYLRGGDDRVITKGGLKNIIIRVISDQGNNTIDDSSGNCLHVYTSGNSHSIIPGPETLVNKKKYVPPVYNLRAPWIPPRDWGKRQIPLIWLGGGPDVGLFLGGGYQTTIYRFRSHPYKSHHILRFGHASTGGAFRVQYNGDFHLENSKTHFNLSAQASRIEIVRFYGFGNETSTTEPDKYYRVKQEHYFFNPALTIPVFSPLIFSIGPTLKYSITKLDQDRLIGVLQPYGSDSFGQIGIRLGFNLEAQDRDIGPTRGVKFTLESRYFPKIWDVTSSFGDISGQAVAFFSALQLPFQPCLALRMGGKHIFGTYPFHEAAFLGGGKFTFAGSPIRGFPSQRFAGNSSLFSNAELRFRLSDFYFLFPGEIGFFGLGDIGRVFLKGETSNKWHTAIGGGIWMSFLERRYTINLSLAKSEERVSFYVSSGFIF
jgi:hypothetical protein